MRRLHTTAAAMIAAFAMLGPVCAANAGPLVQVADGKIEGVSADGVEAFKGVPFAQAPVGPLRWRPPSSAVVPGALSSATRVTEIFPQSARQRFFMPPIAEKISRLSSLIMPSIA